MQIDDEISDLLRLNGVSIEILDGTADEARRFGSVFSVPICDGSSVRVRGKRRINDRVFVRAEQWRDGADVLVILSQKGNPQVITSMNVFVQLLQIATRGERASPAELFVGFANGSQRRKPKNAKGKPGRLELLAGKRVAAVYKLEVASSHGGDGAAEAIGWLIKDGFEGGKRITEEELAECAVRYGKTCRGEGIKDKFRLKAKNFYAADGRFREFLDKNLQGKASVVDDDSWNPYG